MDYAESYQKVMSSWKSLKDHGFPDEEKASFLKDCEECRRLFHREVVGPRKNSPLGLRSKGSPGYKNAIMFYEHEDRCDDALHLIVEAIEIGSSDPWYQKKQMSLQKKTL